MQDSIKHEAVAYVFNAPVEAAEQAEERHQTTSRPNTQLSSAMTEAEQAIATTQPQNRGTATKKVGRNQPCPCGSGKKYKNCHGAPTGPRA